MMGYTLTLQNICIIHQAGWLQQREVGLSRCLAQEKKKHKTEKKRGKKGRERATWTPSVSAKVNISDIPPGTLAYRDQRSWWQTSDPGALRGQERSLWNLSAGGRGTQRYIQWTRRALNERMVDYKVSGPLCKTQPVALQENKRSQYKNMCSNTTAEICSPDPQIFLSPYGS